MSSSSTPWPSTEDGRSTTDLAPSSRSTAPADRLLGEFTVDLAAAVRAELELGSLRRAPRRRGILADLAVLLAGGVALVLAAGAATAAVVLVLAHSSAWVAAAVAAGLWTAAALVTLRGERARRILAAIAPEPDDAMLAAAERDVLDRLDALRATARRLAAAAEREAMRRLRGELLDAALAPARATLDLLRPRR